MILEIRILTVYVIGISLSNCENKIKYIYLSRILIKHSYRYILHVISIVWYLTWYNDILMNKWGFKRLQLISWKSNIIVSINKLLLMTKFQIFSSSRLMTKFGEFAESWIIFHVFFFFSYSNLYRELKQCSTIKWNFSVFLLFYSYQTKSLSDFIPFWPQLCLYSEKKTVSSRSEFFLYLFKHSKVSRHV